MLNTSWTLHRLSPLHHEKEFSSLVDNPDALKTYATRLRDQLTGNVLSGFQVGTSTTTPEEESLSRTGALKECTWEAIPSLSLENLDSASNPVHPCGILVILEYENITYKAALLAPPDESHSTSDSTYLPLLLARLPGPLRQTFISFLSANFDTYCSVFRLPSQFLCAVLESYTNVLTKGHSRASARSRAILEDHVKEVQITVSFSPSVAPALRSLNINIPRGSIADFLPATEQDSDDEPSGSILSGLSAYIEKHLAMDLDLAGSSARDSPARKHVRITKIACGGFVLGAEGKLKLVAQPARTSSQDDDSGDDDTPSERNRLALRAGEVLLYSVVRRALVGESQAAT
ncbi:hypothetical protein BBP40_012579 [Aspergillus hancockii]|nr:hypothetical protein BBP40_012579 [Aspergillus hancockii]